MLSNFESYKNTYTNNKKQLSTEILQFFMNIYCKTLSGGCFSVKRVVKNFKLAVTVSPQKRFW